MNNKKTSAILCRYAALEREVQTLIESRCSMICSNCLSACCCRTDICEEAFDSALLKKLHGQDRTSSQFSDRYGWIDERGCSLTIGRPPICYEFFCDEILNSQPDDLHRYILTTLGQLVSHAGENVLGDKHLIDIRTDEELEQVDFDYFVNQLNEARSALEHIHYFYENNELEHDGLEQLRKIQPPPENLEQESPYPHSVAYSDYDTEVFY